jgi:hypothetical protein
MSEIGWTRNFVKETFAVRSVINRGANKNSLFDQNINASFGEPSFDIGDFIFFSDRRAGKRACGRPHFEHFGGGFDSCVGTEPLYEQAEFCEIVVARRLCSEEDIDPTVMTSGVFSAFAPPSFYVPSSNRARRTRHRELYRRRSAKRAFRLR